MADYTIAVARDGAALAALVPEWTRAFYTWAVPNPFAHPLWLTTWARHFVAPGQLRVLVARDRAGELAGIAPFYRLRRLGSTALHLLGTGKHERLTELPQVLTRPGHTRPVLRAFLHHIFDGADDDDAAGDGWDWVELSLTAEQGWLEPEWLPDAARAAGAFRLHKASRPCVVLPLPAHWDTLKSGWKRNLKESVRRGANSLARAGHDWSVATPVGSAALHALDTIVTLHGARAAVDDKTPHPDYFTNPKDVAFLRDAVRRLGAAGHGGPAIMEIDGTPAAGRLILHANGTTFFSFSGFDPRWWSYNTPTTLMAEGLRAAIARGDQLANLSLGPDVAKLRWSEQLDTGHDFVVVAPRRRSHLVFNLFWQLRAAAIIARERHHLRRPAPQASTAQREVAALHTSVSGEPACTGSCDKRRHRFRPPSAFHRRR
jgi:CelD/BcsL family acetyltransferase involved in cellulose biosynthesis